jgi:hypothetical protein
MANSRSRTINYTPRYTQWEAFDLCHWTVRAALTRAVISFDTVAVLNYQKKHGARAAIDWIALGNHNEAKRYWIKPRGVPGTKGYVPGIENPCVTLKLRPLTK